MSEKFNRLKQLLSCGATQDECLFYECNDNLIIIGANKQQSFKLPFSIKLVKKLILIYTQNDDIIIKKTLDDFDVAEFDDSLIYFDIQEADTLKFHEGKANAQMKVLLEDDSILVSSELYINAVKTLDGMKFNITKPSIESIHVNVSEQTAKAVQFSSIAAGSNQTHYCKFVFDSSWDKLEKKAIFKDEYNEYIDDVKIDDNDICTIPPTIIAQPGNIYIGVVGKNGNIVRPTEWSNSIRVLNSCTYKGFVYSNNNKEGGGGGPVDVPYADENTAGIMKLYDKSGNKTDGSMTQRSVTAGLNQIKENMSEGFDQVQQDIRDIKDDVTSISFDLDKNVDDCLVLRVDFEQGS